ncbi:SIR2 family protein [Azospirillum sp. B4]|uniref:SIR2 family protein n=1 Tax=Azospirillum sp. B4 TaxID=95605 RepID=UPI000346616E|nr:SIR2 family protein [Azospirillum sp. B4]
MSVDEVSRHWPYPISGHNHDGYVSALLSRALDTGRAVAFVGSGVSMAYGRISWQDLIYAAQKHVDWLWQKYEEKAEVKQSHTLEVLRENLDKIAIRRGIVSDTQILPTIYQLCERIVDELKQIIERSSQPDDWEDGFDLRRTTAQLVRDDLGHARSLLTDALADSWNRKEDARQGLEKAVDQLFKSYPEEVSQDRVAHHLTNRLLGKLVRIVKGEVPAYQAITVTGGFLAGALTDLLNYAEGEAEHANPGDLSHQPLLPIRRFIFGALLRAVPYDKRQDAWNNLIGRPKGYCVKERLSRHQRVPFSRDPLSLILDRLRITRFLTTNYDLEIEMMLEELGYRLQRTWKRGDSSARGQAGDPTANAMDFTPGRSADLIAFSCRDRGREKGPSAEVMHLHGQADTPAAMTIVDDDYHRKYVRLGAERRSANNALRLGLSANPILFIGLGMGEDDVLRPMREFMGENDETERLAIALMPDLEDSRTQRERIILRQRYGVEVIHFGQASMEDRTARIADDGKSHPWLRQVLGIKRSIEVCLSAFVKDMVAMDPQESRGSPDKMKRLHMVQDSFIRSVANAKADVEAGIHRLGELDPAFIDTTGGDGLLAMPVRLEGIVLNHTTTEKLEIGLEIKLLNASITFMRRLADQVPEAPTAEPAGTFFAELRHVHPIVQAYLTALLGAGDALTSAFLCACLYRVRWGRDDWHMNWREAPRSRAVKWSDLVQVPPNAALEKQAGLELWCRHSTVLPSSRDHGDHRARQFSRFYRGAPSQTFNAFAGALKPWTRVMRQVRGRRVLLLLARRGVGKGHFVSSLENKMDKGALSVLWRRMEGKGPGHWQQVIFCSLIFSSELGSVLDGLIERLSDFVVHLFRQNAEQCKVIKQSIGKLKNDRIGRLEYVGSMLSRSDVPGDERILIVINGVSNLFDAEGAPKNGQIRKIFGLLWGEDLAKAPVDFVLVAAEVNVPCFFRKGKGAAKAWPPELSDQTSIVHMPREGMDVDSKTDVQARLKAAGLEVAKEDSETLGPEVKEGAVADGKVMRDLVGVHVLREARACLVGFAFFPATTLMLALSLVSRSVGGLAKIAAGKDGPAVDFLSIAFEWRVRRAVEKLVGMADYDPLPKSLIPDLITMLAYVLILAESPDAVSKVLTEFKNEGR